MQELQIFEGLNVQILVEEDVLFFEVYSTGMALGQVKENSAGTKYPRKDRIDSNLQLAEIIPCVRDGHKYITEEQLYDLMLEMRTDKAKAFRKWVTNDVLPSIRKTGQYSVTPQIQLPDFTKPAEAARAWANEFERAETEKQEKLMAQEQLAIAETTIEENAPYVEFAKDIQIAEDTISLNELSRIIHVALGNKEGRDRLMKKLLDLKYIMKIKNKGRTSYIPTQKSINGGWLTTQEKPFTMKGSKKVHISLTTRVTGKGQKFFIKKFKDNEESEIITKPFFDIKSRIV